MPHTEDKASFVGCNNSTDTTVGWTKNTKKKIFFVLNRRKKIIQNAKKLKTSRNMPKLAIRPSTRGHESIEKHGFHHVSLLPCYPKTRFF